MKKILRLLAGPILPPFPHHIENLEEVSVRHQIHKADSNN